MQKGVRHNEILIQLVNFVRDAEVIVSKEGGGGTNNKYKGENNRKK